MRKVNIVVFSSGESEKSGLLKSVVDNLNDKGYQCACWRDLFSNAHSSDAIALLPMLIKKIPTFDFALLVCQGHDETKMVRQGKEEIVRTMRDNVLFEIGLSVMALGLTRVILLTDSKVHIPDDLIGINGTIALKHIEYDDNINEVMDGIDTYIRLNQNNYFNEAITKIDDYIIKNKKNISPVVIGAATSIAEGYASNFIIRLLECFDDGFYCDDIFYQYNLDDVKMKIIIPEKLEHQLLLKANKKISKLKKGILKTARNRQLDFNYDIVDDTMWIIDYPTTLVTSYNTATLILEINSDEEDDDEAKERFYAKELDLFEITLKNILQRSFVVDVIESNYEISAFKKNKLVNKITNFIEHNLVIERMDY